KIARLFAVAKNDRRSILEKRGAEFGQHAGVRRTGVLARAKNIEIAERNRFEPVALEKRLGVEFANVLGDAIGRNRLRLHGFDLGKRGCLAVSGGGRGKHDALDLQFFGDRKSTRLNSSHVAISYA